MARVVIEQLSKVYPGPRGERIRALKEASLTIESGELLVVAGPSGCGKTTLLRLLAGLERADAGTISMNGRRVNDLPPKERDVAMVFQNPALYPHLSAGENMAFGLKLRKCPRVEMERRVREAAEMLGVADCLDRKPMELSGGQRQRVALGRALVRRPGLFLLDEPLSNLDAPKRAQMRAEISRLHSRLAATMIYVTHDQSEAMTLGNRIALLREGVVQQIAEPLAVYQRPANLFVAGFIGSPAMNFLYGTVVKRDGALWFQERLNGAGVRGFEARLDDALSNRLNASPDQAVILGLRPEQVHVNPSSGVASSENLMESTVELIERMGAENYVYANDGRRTLAARVPGCGGFKPGDKVAVRLDLEEARFFDPVTSQAL